MKKLVFLISIATLTVFVACNRDDNEGPLTEVIIDGESYGDVNAFIDDWGTAYFGPPVRQEGAVTDTHSASGLMFTDDILDDNLEICWPQQETYYVEFGLFTPGLDGFEEGTYNLILNEPSTDQTGNYLGWAYVEFGDGYSGNGEGEVTFTKKGDKYIVEFDVTFGINQLEAYIDASGYYEGALVSNFICD